MHYCGGHWSLCVNVVPDAFPAKEMFSPAGSMIEFICELDHTCCTVIHLLSLGGETRFSLNIFKGHTRGSSNVSAFRKHISREHRIQHSSSTRVPFLIANSLHVPARLSTAPSPSLEQASKEAEFDPLFRRWEPCGIQTSSRPESNTGIFF